MRTAAFPFLFALPLLLLAVPGHAADPAPGPSLMLAAIVARHAASLGTATRAEIADLANGRFARQWTRPVIVTADDVTCRISDVDITSRACRLRFGGRTVTLRGLRANALYATLLEAGLHAQGAAGSAYLEVSHLRCVIDPAALRQKAGGGASCTLQPAG